jgi:hypothetical protein
MVNLILFQRFTFAGRFIELEFDYRPQMQGA